MAKKSKVVDQKTVSQNITVSALGLLAFALVYVVLETIRQITKGIEVSYMSVGVSFFGGLIFAYSLSWMISKIKIRKMDLFAILWLTLFIIQHLSNMIEGIFFTTSFSSTSALFVSLAVAVVNTFVESLIAVLLFYRKKSETRFFPIFSDFFKRRSSTSWFWRIVASSLAYLPIYFFFGMLISPFIMPYYANSPTLRIPSFTVIIPVEILRGFLYTVVLLPLISVAKASRRDLAIMLAAMLYIPGAFLNLIIPSTLPPAIVPFHLLEILGDSVVYGFVIVYLLGPAEDARLAK